MLDLPGVAEAVGREGEGLNVLVVRLGAMGDVLRTVPAVRLLRAGLPRAEIRWIVESTWSAVLDGHPDLDGVVALPRRRWAEAVRRPSRWTALLAEVAGLRRSLREPRARLALDFHGNLRSGLTLALSGASVRLGYDGHQQKEGNRWFTTHRIPAGARRRSRIERNLDLVRALGLRDAPLPPCDLPLVRRGREEAAAIAGTLDDRGVGYAVLAPGASRRQAYKKPPAALLAGAARRLAEAGLRSLIVWGPGELDDARCVHEALPECTVVAPPTSLETLAGLLERARLFVGGDSGPLHLACAAGCPVLGIYGPTDPVVNRPWGVPHEVVAPAGRRYTGIKRIDREAGGFDGLTAGEVADAAARLVGGRPSPGDARPA